MGDSGSLISISLHNGNIVFIVSCVQGSLYAPDVRAQPHEEFWENAVLLVQAYLGLNKSLFQAFCICITN